MRLVRQSLPSFFLLILVFALNGCQRPWRISQETVVPPGVATVGSSVELSSLTTLRFEPNVGQFGEATHFASRGPGYALRLEGTAVVLDLPDEKLEGSRQLRLSLDGAEYGADPRGVDPLPGVSHYLLGNDPTAWRTDVPVYRAVRYDDAYPDIDVVYYGSDRQLEFDFIVRPGGDPSRIGVQFGGHETIQLDPSGGAILRLGGSQVVLKRPIAYQEINGKRETVEASYLLVPDGLLTIDLGLYDSRHALIIDPIVLTYSTYIGDESLQSITAVAMDEDGYVYLAGWTLSDFLESPKRPFAGWAPYNPEVGGGDALVIKLEPDGRDVIWSTYLGGSDNDVANDIAVDGSGHVYLTGVSFGRKTTPPSPTDFPLENAAFGRDASMSAFVAKLTPEGNGLVFSTLLGAGEVTYSNNDAINAGYGIAVDPAGNVYVTGETGSFEFPTTPNAFFRCHEPQTGEDRQCLHTDFGQAGSYGGTDAYVTKFGPNGQLVYSTLVASTDAPWTPGTRPSLTSSASEIGHDIVVDATGRAVVTGETAGGCPGSALTALGQFPTTEKAFQRAVSEHAAGCWGIPAVFVSILSTDGSDLEYSTLLGSDSGREHGYGLALDDVGHVFVTGSTNSPDFPLAGATQTALGSGICESFTPTSSPPFTRGCHDVFVTEFDPELSDILFSTFLGGPGQDGPIQHNYREAGNDGARSIALSPDGTITVAGWATSSGVPVPEAFQETLRGDRDALVAQWDADRKLVYATYLGGLGDDEATDVVADVGGGAYVVGWTALREGDPDFPLQDAAQSEFGGIRDGFLAVLGQVRLKMIPEGVGYDSENADRELSDRKQSSFSDLKISGTDLDKVEDVIFKKDGRPDPNLIVSNVRSSASEITYNLVVVHGLDLGERDIYLKYDDGRENDLTEQVGHGFLITRLEVSFNQAVNDRSLQSDTYRWIQVARKHGVVHVSFDDDERFGETYTGELRIHGRSGTTSSIQPHPVLATYDVQQLLDGLHLLTMPYPGTEGLDVGRYTFSVDLKSGKWHLRSPDIVRVFDRSIPLEIAAISFYIEKSNGDRLSPPYTPEQGVDESSALLKKLFPVSGDVVRVNHVETFKLHDGFMSDFDEATNQLNRSGRGRVGRSVSTWLKSYNGELAGAGEPLAHAIVAFMPDGIAGTVGGMAWPSMCTILITSDLSQVGSTVVHEIGHIIDSCVRRGSRLLDLGDEYGGGQFKCDLNPPIFPLAGKRYERDAAGAWVEQPDSCPDSPYRLDADGTFVGTFTSFSAYDPVDMKTTFHQPQLVLLGPGRVSYNYMAGVAPDEYWVTSPVYDVTHRVFLHHLDPSKTTAPLLEIAGWVSLDGTAEFSDVRFVADGFETETEPGPYSLEVQNSAGQQLFARAFEINPILLTNPPELGDPAYFRVRVPRVAGAERIILSLDGIEIARQELSRHKPAVVIKSPRRGQEIQGLVDVSWEATDADGESLTYAVIVSPDGSDVGIPVAVDLTETNYRLNLRELGVRDNAWIKIVASDGFNSGEARTSPEIDSSPRLNGITPLLGPQGRDNLTLNLSGSGFATGASVQISEPGVTVGATEVVSSSKIEVTIAIASAAPVGFRDITVRNPNGEEASAVGLFEVIEVPKVDIRLSWSPPESGVTNGPPQNLSAEIAQRAASKRPKSVGARFARKATPSPAAALRSATSALARVVPEVEPNNTVEEAQKIVGPGPILVRGQAESDDAGGLLVNYEGGIQDDLEDLFQVTISSPGLRVTLDSFAVDCDLFLIDSTASIVIEQSATISATGPETIDQTNLAPGSYFVAVTLFDTATPETTTYSLMLEGDIQGPATTTGLQAYRVYRSSQPDAVNSGTRVADLQAENPPVDPKVWTDTDVPEGQWYYEVTAMYATSESSPSNEVEIGQDQQQGEAPAIRQPIADATLLTGTDPFVQNLVSVFAPSEGQSITYVALSSDPGVATVSIRGNDLTVTPAGRGTARVTVVAEDERRNRAAVVFTVTVPTGVAVESEEIPDVFQLYGNYPNPFAAETTIRFDLPESDVITLEVFDALGRRVATLVNTRLPAGQNTVTWNGRSDTGVGVSSGLYIYRLRTGDIDESGSMVLVR